MGGTFDPIHYGHLVAASEVAAVLNLDEVIFVPAGQPWQKAGQKVSPAQDRYQMTVLATASNPLFSVSRADVDRPGESYSIDTMRDLRGERGADAEFYFILGADAVHGLSGWNRHEQLLKITNFACYVRPGYVLDERDLAGGRFERVEVPWLDISSTTCRERVRDGRPLRYLVPDAVIQYIAKRGLYRD